MFKKCFGALAALLIFTAVSATALAADPPLESATLDQSKGDVVITGDRARVGESEEIRAKKFTVSGDAGGHTLRVSNATVPVSIQADADTAGKPITSSSTVGIAEGVHVTAPYITHSASGGVAYTQYPVWFSGLEPGQTYRASTSADTSLHRQVGAATTIKKSDVHGSLCFWRKKGETLSVVVRDGASIYTGIQEVSETVVNKKDLSRLDFAGGDGTAENPYLIDSEAQFTVLDSAPDAYYALAKEGLTVRQPLCEEFGGGFDGKEHTLNLEIVDERQGGKAGLFGTLSESAYVTRLKLSGSVQATGQGSFVGAVAGDNAGSILECTVSATVSGVNAVGGVAGQNRGEIRDCGFTGSILSGVSCGGITAFNQKSILRCFSTGDVSGSYAGGISTGNNQPIEDCYSTGDITGTQTAGGIVAVQNPGGAVRRCFATGTVSGSNTAGGIVGSLTGGEVEHSLALNRAVWGNAAGRVCGSGANGLSYNGAYLYTYVNGEIPKDKTEPGAMHGETLEREALSLAATYTAAGLADSWEVADGLLPQLKQPSGGRVAGQSAGLPPHLALYAAAQPVQEPEKASGASKTVPYSETFWADTLKQIQNAGEGDTIKFNARHLENMPAGTLRALKDRDVTLVITYNFEKITINGLRMHPIPANQVFYTWDSLAALYKEQPPVSTKPGDGGPKQADPPEVPERPQLPEAPGTAPPLWQIVL